MTGILSTSNYNVLILRLMATAVMLVERKGGREMGSGGGNRLSVQEGDIPSYITKNIILTLLSENDNTSK